MTLDRWYSPRSQKVFGGRIRYIYQTTPACQEPRNREFANRAENICAFSTPMIFIIRTNFSPGGVAGC